MPVKAKKTETKTTKKTVTKKAPAKKTTVKKDVTKKVAPKKTVIKKSETKVKKTAVKKTLKKEKIAPNLKDEIVKVLDDGKAENIQVLDLKGKTSIADYIVIASGTSSRHIYALADNLGKKLKNDFKLKPIVEGKSGTDWVVIDAYDVIIHIFHPETRSFYDIEEIWH